MNSDPWRPVLLVLVFGFFVALLWVLYPFNELWTAIYTVILGVLILRLVWYHGETGFEVQDTSWRPREEKRADDPWRGLILGSMLIILYWLIQCAWPPITWSGVVFFAMLFMILLIRVSWYQAEPGKTP